MEDKQYQFLGVAEDTRSDIEQSKDWQHSEIATKAPIVVWTEKPQSDWKFFSRRDQNGSSACMAFSGAKMLGVENFAEEGGYLEMSAKALYQGRANSPAEGMYQQDCLSIMTKPIVCAEFQVPSEKQTETQMDTPYAKSEDSNNTAEKYRAGGYAFINPIDIDTIASVIAQNKAVQLMFYFKGAEWWNNTNTPSVIFTDLQSADALHHGVVAVDFSLINGNKCLIICDSAVYPQETGQRVITSEFLAQRCYGAGYLIGLSNQHTVENKPHYNFTLPLSYGQSGAEVVALQNVLKFESFFPAIIPSTGYFGSITASALQKWQVAHGIYDFANETNLTKIRLGSKSLAILNQVYQ